MIVSPTLAHRACGLVLSAMAAALTLPAPADATVPSDPMMHPQVWGERERIMAQMEHLPEHNLKRAYLLCAHMSGQRVLDQQEAAICSMAGEVLKKRTFAGDFEALLTWWREHRHAEPASESLDNLLAL